MPIRVLECWCHVRGNWSSGPRPLWGTPDTSPGGGCGAWVPGLVVRGALAPGPEGCSPADRAHAPVSLIALFLPCLQRLNCNHFRVFR